MKKMLRNLFIVAAAGCISAAHAAPEVGGIDVTVRRQDGKVAYQGRTDGAGSFATGQLSRGAYTLEVRAKNAASFRGSDVLIAVSAGRGSAVTESGVPGDKFGSGVAMNFQVTRPSSLQGQVSTGALGAAIAGANRAAVPNSSGVRIINGKRYVWMPQEVGSQMGGRWVMEGSSRTSFFNVLRPDLDWLRRQQDLAGQQRGP